MKAERRVLERRVAGEAIARGKVAPHRDGQEKCIMASRSGKIMRTCRTAKPWPKLGILAEGGVIAVHVGISFPPLPKSSIYYTYVSPLKLRTFGPPHTASSSSVFENPHLMPRQHRPRNCLFGVFGILSNRWHTLLYSKIIIPKSPHHPTLNEPPPSPYFTPLLPTSPARYLIPIPRPFPPLRYIAPHLHTTVHRHRHPTPLPPPPHRPPLPLMDTFIATNQQPHSQTLIYQ